MKLILCRGKYTQKTQNYISTKGRKTSYTKNNTVPVSAFAVLAI